MNTFIIIPNCSDLNRGDQALVWETMRIAEDAGFLGRYYVTCEDNEPIEQSKQHGLYPISMLLKHPSRKYKYNDNITYSWSIKLKWGIVAMCDLLISLLLLFSFTRKLISPLLDKDTQNSLLRFAEADAIFIKGGGFLHFYGGLTSLYYAYFSLYHIFYASRLGKKIYILPNSIGPFNGPFVKWLVGKALNVCKVVMVRETISLKMVKEFLGYECKLYPDLALFLPNSKLTKDEIYNKYGLPTGRKLVAITMRPHRFPQSKTPKEDYLKFKREMALFIEKLYEKGFMPMPIDHTLAINSNENDAMCIQEVLQLVTTGHYFYFSDKTLNCQELKSIYSICDYIVGTRFHSVIFSFANGIPGIAITYTGNKAQGIMADLELQDLVIDIKEVTSKKLCEKFEHMLNNEETVKKRIKKFLTKASYQREDLINSLKI